MKTRKEDQYDKDFKKYIQSFGFKNNKILDIGCGEGYKSLYVDNGSNDIWGTDIVDRRLDMVRPLLKFSLSSVDKKLPFKDKYFDVVTNYDVIEHVVDDDFFCREIHRVLKPKGISITFTPNLNRLSNKIIELRYGNRINFPLFLGYDNNLQGCIHLREYTNSSLKDTFVKAGFSDVEILNYWFGLRLPIIEKFRMEFNDFIFQNYAQYLIALCKK